MFLTRGPLPLEAVWREWLLQARGMLPLYCVAAAACANAGWDEVRAVRAACQGGGESESGSSSSSSSSSMGSMGSSSMGSNPDDPHMILGQRLFRVYTHAPPSFTGYPRGSIFRGTLIEDRLSTTWGDHSMVEATRRLLRAALLDGAAGGGSNQKFMLLSESCAPMYHPAVVHQQLLHERLSRIDACAADGSDGLPVVEGGEEEEQAEEREREKGLPPPRPRSKPTKNLFGSACAVASEIGATRAVAFDLTAACSGFVLGLITGSQFIRTGAARNVLVIGADALSRYVDWRDRGTCILFGDGCGAVLLTARGEGEASSASSSPASTSSSSPGNDGLLGSSMASDGAGQKHLNALFACDGGKALSRDDAFASGRGAYANIAMNGQEVFKFAVRAVPAVLTEALRQAELEASDIDWLILHQANQRILDAAATRLGVPHDRVVSNLAEYGNTSAASIPLALDEAVRSGKIKAGDTLALAGFGAGLSWAGAIVRWG